MANGERLPQRPKSRNVSLPSAYYIDDSGNKIPKRAIDLQDDIDRKVISPLSDGQTFHCAVCNEEVYFRIGDIVDPVKPTLTNVPQRKEPRFQHKPGKAVIHRLIETAEMAKDIVNLLIQYAEKQNDWNPKNLDDWRPIELEDLANGVWGVIITREDPEYPGSPLRTTFIVALEPAKLPPKYDDAVLITTSSGQGGDRKRLTLYDSSYKPLSPSRLKKFIAEHRVDSLRVSGYYIRDRSPNKGEGNEHYLPKQIKILDAVKSIIECSRVFVKGVNRVSSKRIQTGAIFGLFDSSERDNVQNLVSGSPLKYTRDSIAESLAKKFGLIVAYDSSTVTTTGRYRFGKAAILQVPGGKHKVLINPSPIVLLKKMERSDWDNTMVIFVKQDERCRDFAACVQLLRKRNPDINLQIRNVHSLLYAEKQVDIFLEQDMLVREQAKAEGISQDPPVIDLRLEPTNNWDDQRSTLAFEAGNRL